MNLNNLPDMSLYEMNQRTLSAVTEDPNGEELGSFCIKQHPLMPGLSLFNPNK